MQTQIIEGTFAEVQRQFNSLPLKPESRLRIIVTEPDASSELLDAHFENAPRRNGLILHPAPELSTTEAVEEALFRADMEDGLGENLDEKPVQEQSKPSSDMPPQAGQNRHRE